MNPMERVGLDREATGGGPREPAARENAERFFQEIFENAHDVIYTTDLAGNFTSINGAGARVTGYGRDELVASNISRIIAPEHLVRISQMTDHMLTGGGPITQEVEIVAKDGRRVPLEVTTCLIVRHGKPAGVHGIARDIAWRKRSDDAVRRRVTHLEALNAITAAADAAPDLPMLLEVAIDRTLEAMQLGIGGVWAGDHHITRGLAPEIGALIVNAAQEAGRGASGAAPRTGAQGVEDWSAVSRGESRALADAWTRIGVRASLTVPIMAVGQCIGALAVASPHARTWLVEETSLFEAVAQQLGATVEGLRLYRETQRRVELTGRLIALNDTLNRQSSVAGVVSAIGQGAHDLSGAQGIAVYLRLPDETVACRWSHGVSSEHIAYVVAFDIALPRTDGTAGPDGAHVPEGAAPALFFDVLELPREEPARRLCEQDGYRALGVWPLTYEGRVTAWVSCYYDTPHVWTRVEREFFQTFTWQAAAVLENARLYEAQAHRAAELEALYDLGGRLRAARTPDEIFQILGSHARRLLHTDHIALTLLGPDRQTLTRVHVTGMPPDRHEMTFPASGSISGRVVETGIPCVADDVAREIPSDRREAIGEVRRDLGPVAVVALRFEDEVIGTIVAGRTRRADRRPFSPADVRLLQGIADMGGTAIHRSRLHHNLEQAYIQMVVSLARAMDARDSYTGGHSERLAEWAEATARALGCGEGEVQNLRWGALLHDIGKIGVPDAILRKPARLTDEEWAVMRAHPVIGEEILRPVERMREVAKILRHHHERWDGTGYPDRLRGAAIPLGARILAVIDAYSAITDERPYKKPRGHEEAVLELRRSAGTHFDPTVAEVFFTILNRGNREAGPG